MLQLLHVHKVEVGQSLSDVSLAHHFRLTTRISAAVSSEMPGSSVRDMLNPAVGAVNTVGVAVV